MVITILRTDLEVIKQKMRKNHLGEITGYGLVILPKKGQPPLRSD